MTLSFYVSKEQKILFTSLYIENVRQKMKEGEHVFSQSNFFIDILKYYEKNKNNIKEEEKCNQ